MDVIRQLYTIAGKLPVGHHEIIGIKPLDPTDACTARGMNSKTMFMRWPTADYARLFIEEFKNFEIVDDQGDTKIIYAKAAEDWFQLTKLEFATRDPRAGQIRWLRHVWRDIVGLDEMQRTRGV